MKHLKIITVLFIGFTACNKTNSFISNVENSNQKLTQIVSDSSSIPTVFQNFEYTNDNISKVTRWSENNLDTEVVTFDYSGSNYILASLEKRPGNYYEYFIDSEGLPIKIIFHYAWANNTSTSEYDFFYDSRSGHIDSVTNVEHNWKFFFQYKDDNVEKIIENSPASNQLDSFSFTYDSLPNAFRDTDPLLYIYTSQPWFDFINYPQFFPQIFSKNMIISSSQNGYGNIETYRYKYTTINNNQLKDFGLIDSVNTAYTIHYFYK